MKVEFKGVHYDAVVWHPARGRLHRRFAYDTETTVVEDPGALPDYIVGTVFDDLEVYFLRRQDLASFWELHRDSVVDMHTAAFDLEVTSKASGVDFGPMVERGLIRDVSIYYRLLCCAKNGDVPHRFGLALMCGELLSVELEKDETIRKDFGRFYQAGRVDYGAMPGAYLEYAARDAIATRLLAQVLEAECRVVHGHQTPPPPLGIHGTNGNLAPWGFLGHDIQLRGDIALRAIERHGLAVDAIAVAELGEHLAADLTACHEVLARHGYVPGQRGNQAVFNRMIADIERDAGITIPVTAKSGAKSQAADELAPLAHHEFVAAFLRAKELDKLQGTYVERLRAAGTCIHPHYTLMVRTGRTSCSGPNIQNLPRRGGVRECIVPRPGAVLLAADYSMLELCTLAQIAYAQFGASAMRDLINAGVDLHRHVAAMVLDKPMDTVTKDERQKAKAVNFGLPGGMGQNGLRAYARASYGVGLTVDEAQRWREAWLNLFPEMRRYLDGGDTLTRVGGTLDLSTYPDSFSMLSEETAAAIVLRVAGGATGTSAGRVFSAEEVSWSWGQIAASRAGRMKGLSDDIAAHHGSHDLQRAIQPGYTAAVPTGRLRADCTYTESRNWPFQALAADGAKLALYELIRAGYRVVAFIHDEVLVEIPETADLTAAAKDVERRMVDAMRWVCPDVEIRVEYAAMRRWNKRAQPMFDAESRLIPWSEPVSVHAAGV